jgi:hypothetical protein
MTVTTARHDHAQPLDEPEQPLPARVASPVARLVITFVVLAQLVWLAGLAFGGYMLLT